MDKKVILLILDGWGASDIKEHNAIWQGNTTNLDRIGKKYPNIEIIASGVDVGLPAGQMGNSEVGHLNIGSGRVVYQDIMKISNAIATGEIKNNRAIIDAIRQTKDKNRKLHFLGLLSNGGVHS
ncbi:MAG: 2,3-bisphosphoglycerate-independent phosphoglycerate mutase, partial [Nitrospinota bacterium]